MDRIQELLMSILREVLGEDYVVTCLVGKINNQDSPVLSVCKKGEKLDYHFDINGYLRGGFMPLQIAKIIVREVKAAEPDMPMDSMKEAVLDYQKAKNKVQCYIINTEANMEKLHDVPYVSFHDLSVVFRIIIDDEDKIFYTEITNIIMHLWGISTEQLYQDAIDNMKEPVTAPLKKFIPDELVHLGMMINPLSLFMSVMTSVERIGGAISILHPTKLRKLAELLKLDILILPCSIHEVILMPDLFNGDYREVADMVHSVNFTVKKEEKLSNNIYHYSRETGKIDIAYKGESL